MICLIVRTPDLESGKNTLWNTEGRWSVTDDALYSQFLAGDISAFDALILKYSIRLVLYLNGLTRGMEDAEDLAIETFAAILNKKPAIRPGNFRAYLYKAARNRATRFHTLRSRLPVFSLDDQQLEEALAVRPEDDFLRDEKRQAVSRCLGRIDPEPREALWLVYCEGLSYAEAAAILKVNEKKINNWLTKGKQQMKAELAKEGITDAEP